ncbi:hypothetical protein [Brucella sp. IR073]|uniref:hypothetical protein n=1 Tax=unclassified Brucella TaxID=2632610 RepID=UPI003B97DA5E
MKQITSANVKLAEYARQIHVVVAPHGVTLEDALKPDFWAHVAYQIKARDKIELWAEDETWYAELIVYKAGRLAIYCECIFIVTFSKEAKKPSKAKNEDGEEVVPGYYVGWGGPVHKWRVVRKSDGEVMSHGHNKDDAIEWAREHVQEAV